MSGIAGKMPALTTTALPSPSVRVSAARARPVAIIVWGVWLVMVAMALLLIARYGSNVPSWDDWDMVPTLTHNQPVTLEWLWSQHNEHRVPVPRLLFLAINRLTLVDFRATMYFDVLALAAVAAAMILVARRLRGRTSITDAFFPVLLLNAGQAVNLLWGWQLQFFVSVVVACIALLALVRSGTSLETGKAATVVAVCALLLPLCGANGLGMVPALALWPLGLALLPERWSGWEAGSWRPSLLVLGLGALFLTGLYFIGWQPVPYHPKSHSIYQTAKTALQFTTIGLGPATRQVWPVSGLAVIGLFAITGLLLLRAWRDRPGDRARSGGLFLFLGALGSLALGLGLGRDGFETRYVTLALPAWCCVYFAWDLYGPGRAGAAVRGLLAVASLAALWPNTTFGLNYARQLRGKLSGFERELVAGTPPHELIRRYISWLHPHQDVPAQYLPMLSRAGIGGYGDLRADPFFHADPIDLRPSGTVQLRWSDRDSIAYVQGPDPRLVFRLPRDRFVDGLRLGYQYRSDDGTLPYIAIRWKARGQADFSPEQYYKYSPTGDRANWVRGTWDRIHDSQTTLTIWLSDTVGEISITPDFRPAVFRITELSLLESES